MDKDSTEMYRSFPRRDTKWFHTARRLAQKNDNTTAVRYEGCNGERDTKHQQYTDTVRGSI